MSTTDEKLQAFETLLSEASQALADLVEGMNRRGDEQSQALADIVAALSDKGDATTGRAVAMLAEVMREQRRDMLAAIEALRKAPPMILDVKPAPVILPSLLKDGGHIEMRIPAPPGGREKVAILRYIPPSST